MVNLEVLDYIRYTCIQLFQNLIKDKQEVRSDAFHNFVINNYWDANVSSRIISVNPNEELYVDIPFMINHTRKCPKINDHRGGAHPLV